MKKAGNWFFYLLFCASLALTWFFHRDATRFSDRGELWSDRAGYYIYLPATFFYHFDTRRMPADLDARTGGGFSLDTARNRIDTKYTYGVALMVSPFFFTAGLVSRICGYDDEHGFSMIYMRFMSLAAVIYLLLGLWFLKKFLEFYFDPPVVLFVIAVIFLGTNLFYYSFIEGLMSHVYSFFLFALFLLALKKHRQESSFRWFIVMASALALAILVRPTNILPALLFFTWDAAGPGEWLARARQLLAPKRILFFLAVLFLLFIPQFVYWKHLSGHWIHFSYSGEGFTNWRHPALTAVLFSPVNGLFTHTPMALLFVAGVILLIFRNKANGWPAALLFILVTLVCASWKMWYFGCSFGQRSYIEYYAILAVPFGYLAEQAFSRRSFALRTLFLTIVLLFAYFNIRYSVAGFREEGCYYGSTWDWGHYYRSLGKAGVVAAEVRTNSFLNDFENMALCPVVRPSMLFTRTGQYSIAAREKGDRTPLYSTTLDELQYPYPKTMTVEAWMLKPGIRPTGASLSFNVTRGKEVIFSDEQPVDSLLAKPLTWAKVGKSFIVPDVTDSSLQLKVSVFNPKHALLYIDDLEIRYRYHWQ